MANDICVHGNDRNCGACIQREALWQQSFTKPDIGPLCAAGPTRTLDADKMDLMLLLRDQRHALCSIAQAFGWSREDWSVERLVAHAAQLTARPERFKIGDRVRRHVRLIGTVVELTTDVRVRWDRNGTEDWIWASDLEPAPAAEEPAE
jgi:hypothetical protein